MRISNVQQGLNRKHHVGKLPEDSIFFNFASNICKDCIVYILKEETNVLSKKELHNIIIERGLWKNIGKARQACVLKNDTSGL